MRSGTNTGTNFESPHWKGRFFGNIIKVRKRDRRRVNRKLAVVSFTAIVKTGYRLLIESKAYPQISKCDKITTKAGGRNETEKSYKTWTMSAVLWVAVKEDILERGQDFGKEYKRKPGGGRKSLPKWLVLKATLHKKSTESQEKW